MPIPATAARAALALLAVSCTATSNPDRSRLTPLSATAAAPAEVSAAEPRVQAAEPPAETRLAASPGFDEAAAARDAEAAPDPEPAAPEQPAELAAAAPDADGSAAEDDPDAQDAGRAGGSAEAGDDADAGERASPAVARVAGAEIPVGELLERLWLLSPDAVRQELEQLVESRFVLAEALRLGIELRPDDVEKEVARSYAALEEEMRARDVTLSVEEYVRRALGLEPAFYNRMVRRQSITHLLAQRAIRAWTLQNERAEVEVLEVADRVEADRIRNELDLGASFEDLCAEVTAGEEPRGERTRLQVVRSAESALARLTFATRVGQVGGPLEDGERQLFVRVEERHGPLEGTWADLRDRVLASLVRTPVRNPEYWQWKIAMQKRYRVDRSPFLDLIGAESP